MEWKLVGDVKRQVAKCRIDASSVGSGEEWLEWIERAIAERVEERELAAQLVLFVDVSGFSGRFLGAGHTDGATAADGKISPSKEREVGDE